MTFAKKPKLQSNKHKCVPWIIFNKQIYSKLSLTIVYTAQDKMSRGKNDTNICAPGKYDAKNHTCFSLKQLMALSAAYNRHLTEQSLGGSDSSNPNFIKIKPDKKYLLVELKQRFDSVCGSDEKCITKQAFMNELVTELRNELDENTFLEDGPDGPIEWLSNFDIEKLIKKYEKYLPNFKFLGAVPLDCEEHKFCSLYGFDFEKIKKEGIHKAGIVFNHDKMGQGGSHWVALFMNLDSGEINYVDSYGGKPKSNVQSLIDRFEKYCKKKGIRFNYKLNTNAFQKDGSECGVYSANFILRRAADEPFEEILSNPMTFKQINSCRNVYFSNKHSQYSADPRCDIPIRAVREDEEK